MAPVLWVLAVLSTITVVHRIAYTYQMTRNMGPVRDTNPIALKGQTNDPATDLHSAPNASHI